jgi:hypothetical protein
MRKTSALKSKAPVLGPEELFDLILSPKPAAAAPQPARTPIKPGVEIEDIGGNNWYVVVNDRPVARYECRADAEHCARNW